MIPLGQRSTTAGTFAPLLVEAGAARIHSVMTGDIHTAYLALGRKRREPADALDETFVLRRRLVLTLALVTSVLATLWGVSYWLFDQRPAAFLVWGYTGLTLLNVWVFRGGGGYKWFAQRPSTASGYCPAARTWMTEAWRRFRAGRSPFRRVIASPRMNRACW